MGYARDLQSPNSKAAGAAAAEVDEALAWASFASARLASEFCESWLQLQCRLVPGAFAGLLLLEEEDRSFAPAAAWPREAVDVAAMAAVAERALRERIGVVVRADAGTALVAYPVEVRGRLWGVVCLELASGPEPLLREALRRLHWGAGWLETLFLRREAEQQQAGLATARMALDMVAIAGEAPGMASVATALASELAVRMSCRRVAIGTVRHGRVRLVALSHAASVGRRHELADSLANAMEEAADQSGTVAFPIQQSTARRVCVAHRDHVRIGGLKAAMSVVLSHARQPVGVILLERDDAAAFDARDVDLAEGVADLLGPVFALQQQLDRPIAGRSVVALASVRRMLLGRRHPTVKLAVLAGIAAIAWLALATGEDRMSGKAMLEGEEQRAAVAPFDGYVATAPRRAGDIVEAGETLATLDTRDMELEALRFESQRDQALLKAQDSEGKHDRPEAAIARANAAEASAQLAGANDKIARARLAAPFRGVVVSGDLSQQLAAPVERGKVLFEVAPLDRYRVVVQVDEREIGRLRTGQPGYLLLNGMSGTRLDFTVNKIVPVAVATDGKNVFRVEGLLNPGGPMDGDPTADAPALRPGMEGVGKIVAGRASLMWIYSHPVLDWARVTLWRLMP